MKSNNELELKDIVIDSDIEASEPNLITTYIETLFDVDKKFGTKTNDDDNRWVNFYAQYNVSDGSLKLSYHIDTPDTPENIACCLNKAGFSLSEHFETEFAHIFVALKNENKTL